MKDYFLPLEVNEKIKKHIGFKSFYLASLTKLEIPTPSRIFLSDLYFKDYISNNYSLDLEKLENVIDLISENSKSGLKDPDKPLIICIKPSKTGNICKLNTTLNIGFNPETVEKLGEYYLRPKFAYESYYHFICNFLHSVFDVSKIQIANIENRFIQSKKVGGFRSLKLNDIKELIGIFLSFANQNNFKIPDSVYEQAGMVIESLYNRWISKEFTDQKIKDNFDLKQGLPIVLEEMTFGNLGENSGSFIAYSRNPNTGKKELCGDFFQLEQLNPTLRPNKNHRDISQLDNNFQNKIAEYLETLETYLKFDICVHGIIEDGNLRIVNLYEIPKTIQAEVQICNDFELEGKLEFKKAVNFINSEKLHLYQNLECQSSITDFSFAKGRLISLGACSGELVFNEEEATNRISNNQNYILFSDPHKTWSDVILKRASGVIVTNKQFTSMLAEKTRELCIPCLGLENYVSITNGQVILEDQKILKSGDFITLDASSGRIFKTHKNLILNPSISPLKDLVEKCKDNLSLKFYSYGDINEITSNNLIDVFLWDTESVIQEGINNLDKLRILFKTINPKELVQIKNNLRDILEEKLLKINSEEINVTFPNNIIGNLIPDVSTILDFVEISKLDYDFVQKEILKFINLSKNGISGTKIYVENENIFAVLLQGFLEAMWKVQTKKGCKYNFILSNVNSPSEYLFFEQILENAIHRLCPDIELITGISITNTSGIINLLELSKICKYITIDLDSIRGSFYGYQTEHSIAQTFNNYQIWTENKNKDFSADLKQVLEAFKNHDLDCIVGIKNNRAYKNNFKDFLLKNTYNFVVCDEKWTLNAIVNLVNTK